MRPVVGLAVLTVLALPACSGSTDAPTGTGATPTRTGTGPSTGTGTPTPPADADPARPVSLPFQDGMQWRIAVAPDGQSALVAWSAGFFPRTRESTIYEVTRGPDGGWTEPVAPAFVTDESADIDPYYTVDGSRVWFSSIRPIGGVPRTDVELWYADRLPDGSWGEPVHATELGSDGEDLYPSIGPDGAMYFGSDRGGAGFDIWRSAPRPDGTWEPPVTLPAPITTSSWEFNPVFAPDGSALVFTAQGRAGGAGAGDLFLSRPEGDGWSEPVPLQSVNTAADEYHPGFSPDGETFYFVRGGRLHQIAVADTELAG